MLAKHVVEAVLVIAAGEYLGRCAVGDEEIERGTAEVEVAIPAAPVVVKVIHDVGVARARKTGVIVGGYLEIHHPLPLVIRRFRDVQPEECALAVTGVQVHVLVEDHLVQRQV